MSEEDPGILKNWSDLLDDATALPPPPGAPPQPKETSFRERYQVVRLIGSGGMGSVYLVHDRVLNREAAMKVCSAPLMDPQVERQFMEEARLAARLEHPNILPVYDMGVDSQHRYFFVMRYVQGQSLAQAIAAGTMPLARRIEGFVQVCNAIRFAHSKGVLHRDIKPQNVLVGPFGETFVIDWGISKLVAPVPSTGAFAAGTLQTLSSGLIGTPAYMAPELMLPVGSKVDERVDVYALGVMLYNLLGVAQPFRAETLVELADAKMNLRVAPPPDEAPREYVAIARKAMAPSPADRYADIGQFVDDITAAQEHRPGRAWRDPAIVRFRKWMRRHPTIVAVAATVLVAFGVYHAYRYARLAWQLQFQTVYLTAKPVDAEVTILRDGARVDGGRTPLVLTLKKGKYHVRCSERGWAPYETEVEVVGGPDILRRDLRLVPHTGRLAVLPSDPEIALGILGTDTTLRRDAHQGPFELEPGRYRVTLTRNGSLETLTREIDVTYGSCSTLLADFSETRLWSWTQAEKDTGKIVAEPALLDANGDGRREAFVPVLYGPPGRETTRFLVLDPATGRRKSTLEAGIDGVVTRLTWGTDAGDRPILLGFVQDTVHAVDPAGGPARGLSRACDAALVRGRLFFAGTGGVGLRILDGGETRVLEKWRERGDSVQVVNSGGRIVVFRDESFHLKATAFHPVTGEVLFEGSWRGSPETNVVSACLNEDEVEDWAVGLSDGVLAIDGATRQPLWKTDGRPDRGVLLHARDALFLVTASDVVKFRAGTGRLLATARYRSQPPHGPVILHASPVDARRRDAPDIVAKDSSEDVLRMFDGETCRPILTRPSAYGFGIVTADLDGDGRGDLLLSTLLGLEALSPGGSGATAITANALPAETRVEGAALNDDDVVLLHPDRLYVARLGDVGVRCEASFEGTPQGVTFSSSAILLRSGRTITALARADLNRLWRIEAPSETATLTPWGRLDADEVEDFLLLQRTADALQVGVISGRDGTGLWSTEARVHPDLSTTRVVDLDGDGAFDLILSDHEVRSVLCARHGDGCKDVLASDRPKALGIVRQRRGDRSALLWHDIKTLHAEETTKPMSDPVLRLEIAPDVDGDGFEEVLVSTGHGVRLLNGRDFESLYEAAGNDGSVVVGPSSRLILRADDRSIEAHDLRERRRAWSHAIDEGTDVTWSADSTRGVLVLFLFEGSPTVRASVEVVDLATGRTRSAHALGSVTSTSRRNFRGYWKDDRFFFELFSRLYRLTVSPLDAPAQPIWSGGWGADRTYSWRP